DNGRNACEVLEQHARRDERDFLLCRASHVPPSERVDVRGFHEPFVFVTQEVLEQHLERIRQLRDRGKPTLFQGGQAVKVDGSRRGGQGRPRTKTVDGHRLNPCSTLEANRSELKRSIVHRSAGIEKATHDRCRLFMPCVGGEVHRLHL